MFIVLKNQCEDVYHLAITAGLAKHVILQLPEGRWQFQERGTVPKSPRLALDDRQIVPPVVNRLWWQLVTALDHAGMFAQDVALSRHHQPVRIDPKADGAVRK